jgi:enoyl-CoA hydratase/carnithine racemase
VPIIFRSASAFYDTSNPSATKQACLASSNVQCSGHGNLPRGARAETAKNSVDTVSPEFIYAGATYDVDDSLARGWVDELVEANALTERARAAAQEMARLSPKAFTQAKKQLRQEVSERVERGGAMTDQTVTDIWTDALGYVRDYVARTLNKS